MSHWDNFSENIACNAKINVYSSANTTLCGSMRLCNALNIWEKKSFCREELYSHTEFAKDNIKSL